MAKLKSGTRIYGTATIDTSVVVGSAVTLSSSGIQVTGISTLNNANATQLTVSGVSTFTNGPVLIGGGTSTGTASQPLQVTGGAYVSTRLGVGVTNPATNTQVAIAGTLGIDAVGGAGTRTLLFSSSTSGFTLNHNDNSQITFQTLGVNRLTYSHSSNLWTIPSATPLLVGTATSTGTADQLLRVEGGAYVSGSLGIGNTNPGAKLDVTGDIRLSASDPEIEFNTGGPRLKVPSANTLTIHTGGGLNTTSNEVIRINNTGVGINTTVPTSKLTVVGDATITNPGANALAVRSGASGSYANFNIGRTTNEVSISVAGNAGEFANNASAGDVVIRTDSTGKLLFTNGASNSTLAVAGNNVLVGTISSTGTASQPLQVNGGGYFAGVGFATGSIGVGITNPQGTIDIRTSPQWSSFNWGANLVIGGARNNALGILDSSNSNPWAIANAAGNLAFAQMPALGNITSGPTEAARITTNRNLLIGTTSETGTAGQVLQVAGINSSVYIGGSLGIGNTNPQSQLHITGQFQSTQANSTTTGGGQIYLNGATGNRIDFNQNGSASPSFTTRSAGTKIVLFPSVGASSVDHAFGIESSANWYSVPTTGHIHRWYGGTTQLADLKGTGEFLLGSTSIVSSAKLQVTGGAYVSDSVGIGTTNPLNRLTVYGTNSDTTPILALLSGNNSNAFNNGAQIAFGYNGTSTYQHFIQTRHNSANLDNAIDFYVSDGTQNNTLTSGSVHTLSLVSGSVGINTTNPGATLNVVPTATSIAGLFSGTTSSDMVRITQLNVSGNALVVEDSANPDATPFVVKADGSVGIGTTNPSQSLDINGNLRIRGGLYVGSANTSGTSGQFLQSTGIGVTWVSSSGGGGLTGIKSDGTVIASGVTINTLDFTGTGITSVSYDSGTSIASIDIRGAQRRSQSFTATSNQTIFTVTNGYTPGYVDVYLNGSKLQQSAEFTATDGSTVVLTSGAAANDIIDVVSFFLGVYTNPNYTTTRSVTRTVATASQTSFSVSYDVGYVDVYLNGSKLDSTEFTATTGSNVVLSTGASANDVLEFISYTTLSINTIDTAVVNETTNATRNIIFTDVTSGSISTARISSSKLTFNPSTGLLDVGGTVRGTSLTSIIATGTAPLTVTSTTKVTNLNADLLDDLNTSSTDTSGNSIVSRSSGNFSAGTITANITGTATTATNAVNIGITTNSSDSTCFIVFVENESTNGLTSYQNPKTASGSYPLTYNAATGTLYATQFSGDGSLLTGITASDITLDAMLFGT